MIRKKGAGEASNIAENNVLLDVERDIIETDGLSAHLQSETTTQEDDTACRMCEWSSMLRTRDAVKPPSWNNVLFMNDGRADYDSIDLKFIFQI